MASLHDNKATWSETVLLEDQLYLDWWFRSGFQGQGGV